MITRKTKIPPAKALINGIRSIGYTFPSAVADIIDNSVTAESSVINVYSETEGMNPYFLICDNGFGMNEFELENAMTFGSNREGKIDSDTDLGRFGLGLKSASLSQCKKFTVISKKENLIHAMEYDVDFIEEKNEWILNVLSNEELFKLPCVNLLNNLESGTIVLWRNFDKLEGATKNFSKSFRNEIEKTKKYIELVFHRFYKEIEIFVNDIRIDKRDPFLLDSINRQQEGRTTEIEIEGSYINVTPFTLPFQGTLTDNEKKLLGGSKIYDEQGFYIYRNKRLISWGSWMYMSFKSETFKLARVRVDIPSTLDKIWHLDVKKTNARIPEFVKERLYSVVSDSTIKSKRVVQFKGKKEASFENKVWDRITNSRDNTVSYKLSRENCNLIMLKNRLNIEEMQILNDFICDIESYFPKHRLSNDLNEEITIQNNDDRSIEEIKEIFLRILDNIPYSDKEKKFNELLRSETFFCLQQYSEKLKEEL